MSHKFLFNKLIALFALAFACSAHGMNPFGSVFREYDYQENNSIEEENNSDFPEDLPPLEDENEEAIDTKDLTHKEHTATEGSTETTPPDNYSAKKTPENIKDTQYDKKNRPKRTKKTQSTKVTGSTKTIDITEKHKSESSIKNNKNEAIKKELDEILKQRTSKKNSAPKKAVFTAPKKPLPKKEPVKHDINKTLDKAIELLREDFKNTYGNTHKPLKNQATVIELLGQGYHEDITIIYGLLANPQGNNIEQAHKHTENVLKKAGYSPDIDLIELEIQL